MVGQISSFECPQVTEKTERVAFSVKNKCYSEKSVLITRILMRDFWLFRKTWFDEVKIPLSQTSTYLLNRQMLWSHQFDARLFLYHERKIWWLVKFPLSTKSTSHSKTERVWRKVVITKILMHDFDCSWIRDFMVIKVN